jgi:O-antigen/teichoic acid export membrane protein
VTAGPDGADVASDWTPPDDALGTRAASGIVWLTAAKWVVRVSGLLTLALLTRLVGTYAIGTLAAAMAIIPMIYLLADLGFTTYLLQADDVDQEQLSTAFWASAAAGAVLSVLLVVLAPVLASAFDSPDLERVLPVLVLAVVATVAAAVPLALLKRAMAFRTVAVQSLVASLLAQVVAILVAVSGGGVWALIVQVIVTQAVIAVLAWRYARWSPSLLLSRGLFWRMATFGIRVSAVDLVATVRIFAEAWIIAAALGPVFLGVLLIAQRVVQTAQDLTAASLVPVATVLFARVRETTARLRTTYVKALGASYAVVSPLMVLIVVTAPLVMPVAFVKDGTDAVLPVQALAVAGILVLGAMLDHGVFYGIGRPGTWLSYAVVVDAVTVATTAFAVHWKLPGVAIGFVVVAFLATVARWLLVSRVLGMPASTVARPFGTILVPTAVTTVAGLLLLRVLEPLGWPLVCAAVITVATLVLYVVLVRLLAARILRDVVRVAPVPDRYAGVVRRVLRLEAAVVG